MLSVLENPSKFHIFFQVNIELTIRSMGIALDSCSEIMEGGGEGNVVAVGDS